MTTSSRRGARLRVLHISSPAFTLARFRLEILEAQRAAGHQVETASRSEPAYVKELQRAGFPVHVVDLPRRLHPVKTLGGLLQLRRLIKRGRFDVVHVHQPMGALVGIPAAKLAGQGLLFYTTGGLKAHAGMRAPVRIAVQWVERLLCSSVNAVFSVNREDVAEAVARKLVSPDRIFYVGPRGGCGIDTDRYRPPADGEAASLRSSVGLPPVGEAFLLGITARTVWEKGYRELIDAVAGCVGATGAHSLHLVIAGDGADFESIRDRAAELGIASRITFLGRRSDIPELLRTFDAFVLPSFREGMPVSLLEAMATGLPVIASCVRGSSEVVEDGVNGLLVPPRNADRLRKAILRLSSDRAFARRIGKRAMADVRDRFATDVVLPRYMALYDRLIEAAGERPPRRSLRSKAEPRDTNDLAASRALAAPSPSAKNHHR